MTCGSKKHIEDALTKIHVHEIEKPQDERKVEPKSKRSKILQE